MRSGVAANSAELVAALRAHFDIDVFVDQPIAHIPDGRRSAHDFIWLHRTKPYDLTVYQLGNSSHHNYLWPYLFRFPGLVVLHDAQLHHARAAALLTENRTADYLAEFAANHPDVSRDLAQLAAAGFDSYLYYMWPMTRLVVEAARVAAVHSPALAEQLRDDLTLEGRTPPAIEAIALTQGVTVTPEREARARRDMRARHAVADGAVLFGVFGGLTPEKRIPQVLDAFAATRASARVHLLLAGAPAAHFDLASEIRARGLEDVTVTGYLDTDDELTDAIAACDVSLNLRWPTAREMSGPWLRALAAGKPTITLDLAHLWDVPSLDPRTWTANRVGDRGPGSGDRGAGSGIRTPDIRTPDPGSRTPDPVTVAIDILDEDHSLRLAMRRLAQDAGLRASLGAAAREHWLREHSLDRAVADYERVIDLAMHRPAPPPPRLSHLSDDGRTRLRELMEPFGLTSPLG